jgi:hypothetical protein
MLLVQPGAAAFVQQAVGIARALPSARPAGVELSTFVAWHRGAAAMVAALSVALLQSHHAAVGSSSSSSSGRNGTSGAAPPEAALRRELQAAAWEVVDLVPHMARVLQVLSAERADVDDLASVCQNYAAAVSLLGMQGVTLAGIRSGSELAAWAAAADSAARLLPLLAQLNAGWQGLPEEAAFLLAKFLLLSLTTGSSYLAYAWVNSGVVTRGTAACSGQPPAAHLAKQLCRLHKSSCSLAHWLWVEGNHALMPGCFDAELCCQLLEAVHWLMLAAQDLLKTLGRQGEELGVSRCVPVLCSCCPGTLPHPA